MSTDAWGIIVTILLPSLTGLGMLVYHAGRLSTRLEGIEKALTHFTEALEAIENRILALEERNR